MKILNGIYMNRLEWSLEDNTTDRQNSYMTMVHRVEYIMTNYYDIILGLIPLALFGIAGTLTIFGLQMTVAVPMAATVAVGLIGHALFINQPEAPVQSVTDVASDANATTQSASISAD